MCWRTGLQALTWCEALSSGRAALRGVPWSFRILVPKWPQNEHFRHDNLNDGDLNRESSSLRKSMGYVGKFWSLPCHRGQGFSMRFFLSPASRSWKSWKIDDHEINLGWFWASRGIIRSHWEWFLMILDASWQLFLMSRKIDFYDNSEPGKMSRRWRFRP